jgi:hypothetical protein
LKDNACFSVVTTTFFVQVVGDLDAAQTEQCLNGTGGFFNDYM